jgi:hypothetical protein
MFSLLLFAVLSHHLDVHLITDEADALAAILDERAAAKTITDADWQRLFTSEGFGRLKKRENSMHRAFDEELFRKFVLSDDLLARRESRERTLEDWKHADLTHAANLAFAYLPANATIRAKVYPVIKPQSNSFVFELDSDPAIFKYIEDQPGAAFEATMSHEMHHVGYANACPSKESLQWLAAFGEGFAVLAAAGGPDRPAQAHPERPDLQRIWDAEMAKYETNFQTVEAFLLDVAEGRVSGDTANQHGFAFYGLLGPWYTVGWKMAVVIEKTLDATR